MPTSGGKSQDAKQLVFGRDAVLTWSFCYMDLLELLDSYFAKNLKIRDDSTKRKYRYAIDDLSEAIGHAATLDDLTDDNVAAMMNHVIASGRSVVTANDKRKRIHALWTWLARRGEVSRWPTTPQLPEPRRIPHAWTVEQLERLVAVARAQRGWMAGIPAGRWWYALHLVCWDTAERIGAIMQIPWAAVDLARGWLLVDASIRKGKASDEVYRLGSDTIEALRLIENPVRELVFPWDQTDSYLWLRYESILRAAELPVGRKYKFHALRRSVASHLKRLGGDAQSALGHASPEVTRRYFDPRIAGKAHPSDLLPRISKWHPRGSEFATRPGTGENQPKDLPRAKEMPQ